MIVVDASAMVTALVAHPVDEELIAVLAEQDLHAPALLDFEVASALRGLALGGKLNTERLQEAVEDFLALHIERHDGASLLTRALDLRDNFTAYDAAYLSLAEGLRAPVLTADRKLLPAENQGIEVILVST